MGLDGLCTNLGKLGEDFLLQAVVRALIDLPAMNATYSGDHDGVEGEIVAATGTHIGLVFNPMVYDIVARRLARPGTR